MSKNSPARAPAPRVPSYRRHKPSGQAVVTLNGHDIYLGPWKSKVSRPEEVCIMRPMDLDRLGP